jgi:hypothetical protein
MSFSWLKNTKTRPRAFLRINSRKEYFNFYIQSLKAVKNFKKARGKKILPTLLLIFIISALGIFAVGTKEAKAGLIGETVLQIMGWFSYYIFQFFALLLRVAGLLLDWAFGIERFTDVPVVQEGWRISRGVVNLFFVLILMFIAFTTILRLDEKSYGLKALLPKLIIAALLINFSLVIAGAIIDFTQVLSHYFLKPFEGKSHTVSEIVVNGLGVHNLFKNKESAEQGIKGMDGINVLVGIIGGVAVIIVMTIVIGAAAGFLIVRVVALWILLVLAPIAWLFWILPSLNKQWSNWWSSFLKWAFFAPAYAFFFYLTLLTIGHVNEKGEVVGGFLSHMDFKVPLGQEEGWASAFFSSSQLIVQYIFLVILLIASIVVAQKAGVYGAGYAMSAVKWVGKGAAGGASRWLAQRQIVGAGSIGKGISKIGDKLAGKRIIGGFGRRLKSGGELLSETKGMGILSPGAWKRGWESRRKETEARAYARPTGAMRDQFNYIMSLGKERTKFAEQAEQVEVNRRVDEIGKTSRNTEVLLDGLQRATAAGNKIDTSAYLRLLFQQNDQNEIIKQSSFGAKYDRTVSDESVTNVTYDILEKAGFSKEEAAKTAMEVGNVAFASGNYMHFGMGRYNLDTGKFERPVSLEKQREIAAGKTSNMEPQQKTRGWHWGSIMKESKEGDPIGLHEGGKELLKTVTAGDIEQLNRVRIDFIRKVGSEVGVKGMRDFADEVEKTDRVQGGLIKRFAAQLHLLRTGEVPDDWYDEDKYGELRWKPKK